MLKLGKMFHFYWIFRLGSPSSFLSRKQCFDIRNRFLHQVEGDILPLWPVQQRHSQ